MLIIGHVTKSTKICPPDQTCAKIQKRSGILDPQDPRSRILDLIFSFSIGILEILDPATTALPCDPRNLGSRTETIWLDPWDPGPSLGRTQAGHRGILQILDLTQQYVTAS